LASTVACRVFMAAAKVSRVALRSPLSPMLTVLEAVDDEGVLWRVREDGAECGGGGEGPRTGEERRDRDTRLSRASAPRDA
jgi:hypothetical protein